MGNFLSSLFSTSYVPSSYMSEKYLHAVFPTNGEELEKKPTFFMNIEDLKFILMSNPHLIQEKDAAIECLIDPQAVEGKKIVNTSKMFDDLDICHRLTYMRSKKPCNDIPIPIDKPDTDNSQLMELICTQFFSYISNLPYEDKVIQNGIAILKNTPLTPGIFPIDPKFLLSGPEYSGLLHSWTLCTYGIASNGLFLFTLSHDMTLHTFPLLYNGCMLPPFTHNLKLEDDPDASVFLTNEALVVNSNGENNYFNLNKLTMPKSDGTTVFPYSTKSSREYKITFSDGATIVRIDSSYNVFLSYPNSEKYFHCSRLSVSNVNPYQNIPEIINRKLFSAPAATNGVFITFYLKVDESHYCCRQFSTLTGEFVGDFIIETQGNIISAGIDIINKIHWIATNTSGHLIIHSYQYIGTDDPFLYNLSFTPIQEHYQHKLINNLCYMMSVHLFSSMGRSPSSFFKISDTKRIKSLLGFIMNLVETSGDKLSDSLYKTSYIAILQLYSIIVSSNLKEVFEINIKSAETLQKSISFLLIRIPGLLKDHSSITVATLLLFRMFDKLFEEDLMSMLIGILESAPQSLSIYILREMERSDKLSKVMTTNNKIITSLLDSNTNSIKSPNIIGFLYVQQKVIIREVQQFLENDKFSSIKIFGLSKSKNSPLDVLSDYSQYLVDQVLSAFNAANSLNDLFKSTTFLIFDNFLDMILGLSKYHAVAQVILPLLNVLPDNFLQLLKNKDQPLDSDPDVLDKYCNIAFTFGIFAATMIKGGDFSSFEDHYKWLIRPNMFLNENKEDLNKLLDPNIDFNNEKITNFVNNGIEQMRKVYKKWKPAINANLKEPYISLDRLSLAPMLIHLDLIEIFDTFIETGEIDIRLRPAFDQMVRVRNTARVLVREGQGIDNIIQKCKILIKMKTQFSDENDIPKMLSDFIVSTETADSLIHYISNQNIRIVLTGIGFSFLENLMSQNLGKEFVEVVSDALSRIDNFDGLSSILRCYNKPLKGVSTFIDRVIASNNKHLLLIVHKLIKSGAVSQEDIGIYMQKLYEKFKTDTSNNSLFGLIYGRIGSIPNIFQDFNDLNSLNEYNFYFLSDALSTIQCSIEQYQMILQFVVCPCNEKVSRFASYALFNAMCSKKIPPSMLKRDFLMLIDTIGHFLLESKYIYIVCELISLLRNMLTVSCDSTNILYDTFSEIKPDKAKSYTLCGLFAILGGNVTCLTQYSCVSLSTSREKIKHAVLIGDPEHPLLYELPISSESKPMPSMNVVLIPEETIKFTPLFFYNFEYIKSFFDVCTSDMCSIIANMYLSSLFVYTGSEDIVIEREFASKVIDKLSHIMNPCDSINMYSIYVRQEMDKPNLDKVNDFYTLINESSVVTYLSPIIDKCIIYEVSALFKEDFTGYFGVTTDSLSSMVKYTLLSHGGLVFDSCINEYDVEIVFEKQLDFIVNPIKNLIQFGNKSFKIPSTTENSRIVIATHQPNSAISIKIPNQMKPFNLDVSPQLEKIGFIGTINKNVNLYSFPEWSNVSLSRAQSKLQKFRSLPRFVPIISDTGDESQMYPKPPEDMTLHFIDAVADSYEYKNWAIKTYTFYNNSQWSTVVMMNMVLNGYQQLIDKNDLMRLFNMLLIPLEHYSEEAMKAGEFPFLLDFSAINQTANVNELNFDIQKSAQKAISLISQDVQFRDSIQGYIASMMNSWKTHLLLDNKLPIAFFPRGTVPINYEINANASICDSMIIAPPVFNTINQLSIQSNGKTVEFPVLNIRNFAKFNLNGSRILQYPLTALLISKLNNSWVYGTSIELLILLKEYSLLYKDIKSQIMIHSLLIDLILIQSPFIWTFVKQFLIFYGQDFIPPSNITSSYISRLLLLGTFLNYFIDNDDSHLMSFFIQEIRLLTSDLPLMLSPYFPEFFSSPPPKPMHSSITLMIPSLDIDLNMTDPLGIFMLVRSILNHSDDLHGFPFWEVLPIWMSFTLSNKNFGKQLRQPMIRKINNTTLSIINPDQILCDVVLVPIQEPPPSVITLISAHETFDDPQCIEGPEMKRPIRFHGKSMYISFVDYSSDFVEVKIEKVNDIEPETSKSTELELVPANIHDEFVYEMYLFVKQWTSIDTSNLLLSFPSYMFEQNKFSLLKEGLKSSPLISQYPSRVVLLYTYLIHRLNYLWKHKKISIPNSFWNQVIPFITLDFAAEQFTNAVLCSISITPLIVIDRHEAHRLIIDGRGSHTKSVIYQFSNAIRSIGSYRMRTSEPWTVEFKGESAIDAGGPRHELFWEISDSIFQPTSRLFVLSPNGRYHCGFYRDVYVPSTTLGKSSWQEYRAIGVFIGVIARTGFPQPMPFAPIVWKFIASEPITKRDILDLDERLKNHLNRLKMDFFQTRWTVEGWDGSIIELRGTRQNVKRNEVDNYISECLQVRINSIEPMMRQIRQGFVDNVGNEAADQITAGLLNLITQGSNVITVSQLKNITIFSNFRINDKMIDYFWQAVERMTNEQRSLLLQFITTFKRLPNPSVNTNFRIKVSKSSDTDEVKLPSASTCFNNLYLPQYPSADVTYRKLLAAIEFCQTMENA